MWHSSPSPKYSRTSSGHWLASARNMRSGIACPSRAHALDARVRFRQVLVARAFALAQIRHGVQPQAIHPGIEPEPHDVHDRIEYLRIGEVQVRLVREKAMPVIRLRFLSHVQLDFSVSLKMMRVPLYLCRCRSRHRSRACLNRAESAAPPETRGAGPRCD